MPSRGRDLGDMVARGVRWIDFVNEQVGRVCGVLLVAMVLTQIFVVVTRYVFGISYLYAQEAVIYLHATIFLAAAGYALLHDDHVRIDIFYQRASARTRALINIFGIICFLWPMCFFVFISSWRFVANSWRILEGSPEGTGLPFLFALKSMILIFAALLGMQGLSRFVKEISSLARGHLT